MPREIYELTPPQLEWLIENQSLTNGEALDESSKMGWGRVGSFGGHPPPAFLTHPQEHPHMNSFYGQQQQQQQQQPGTHHYHQQHHSPPHHPHRDSYHPAEYQHHEDQQGYHHHHVDPYQQDQGYGDPFSRAHHYHHRALSSPHNQHHNHQNHHHHSHPYHSSATNETNMDMDHQEEDNDHDDNIAMGSNNSNSESNNKNNKHIMENNKPDHYPHRVGKLTWEQSFENLKIYADKNGHCNVPRYFNDHPQLGSWVHRQRLKRKSPKKYGYLSPDQVQQLTDLGFCWQLRGEGKQNYLHEPGPATDGATTHKTTPSHASG